MFFFFFFTELITICPGTALCTNDILAKMKVLEAAELKLYSRKKKSYYMSGSSKTSQRLFLRLACSVGKTCDINLMASRRI